MDDHHYQSQSQFYSSHGNGFQASQMPIKNRVKQIDVTILALTLIFNALITIEFSEGLHKGSKRKQEGSATAEE